MKKNIKTKWWQWIIIFSVLTIWTAIVITGARTSNVLPSAEALPLDNNIYITDIDGNFLTQASRMDILEFLFKHDFSLEKKEEIIPSSQYSIRAVSGLSTISNPTANRLSLTVIDTKYKQGIGSLTLQGNRRRISLEFKDFKILDNSPDILKVMAEAKGNDNQQKISETVTIEVDKSTRFVDVEASGDIDFSINNMDVTICEGCENEEVSYFLLVDEGELDDSRDIMEVRDIINQNPEILNKFMKLDLLNTPNWALIVPPGLTS